MDECHMSVLLARLSTLLVRLDGLFNLVVVLEYFDEDVGWQPKHCKFVCTNLL